MPGALLWFRFKDSQTLGARRMSETVTLRPEPLLSLLSAILRADGCGEDEADCVADHLVSANLCGHDSHGVIRILRYHEWLGNGRIKPRRHLRLVTDLGVMRHYDGGDGLGQCLAREATREAVGLAQRFGVGLVALRRAGHIGRVGAFAEQSAVEGLISILFTNVAGSRLVAPYGSTRRTSSTAPVTIGVPNPRGDDFILDFATSMVSEGKALVAARGGKRLPDSALIDAAGALSSDPGVLYGETLTQGIPDPRRGEGALRAFGEHKGSGLMLACELLGGALTGNGTNGPSDHPFGNGMLAILIDPKKLDDLELFASEVAEYISYVRASSPAQGVDRVLVPGDNERALRAERARIGLPLSVTVREAIFGLAETLDIPVDRAALRAETPRGNINEQE